MSGRFISQQPGIKPLLSAVLFTLAYSPLLGSVTGTRAVAQTSQNTTTSYEYDAMGNRTKITDPLGHVTTQSYDGLGRLVQQVQPVPATGGASPTVSLRYDGQNQLSTVTDPRNLVTSYAVDGLGNQSALTSPDTGSTSKTYDAAGNLATRTDARGKTTTYSYDALNRLTQIGYASGTATQFEYDGGTTGAPNANGRLTKITDGSGQTTYSYGPLGRLQSKTQIIGSGAGAQSATVSYAYGSSGNTTGKLVSTTYPSGNRINYGYDAAGRINSLTLNPTNTTGGGTNTGSTIPLLTGIGYQAFGPVNAWTWGNSSSTSTNTYARGIDLDGRVTSYPLGNALSNGTNRTISYDAASRITATSHSGTGTGNSAPANFNQSYGYDNLDRLNSVASSSTNTQSFQYDQNGNRTQATFGSGSYTNTIATNSNQLTATTGPTPAKSNTYDAVGNLTSDGTTSYTYSDRGRMVSATNAGNTVTYIHNGIDQRVQKQGPTSIIATGSNSYVYDEQGHLIGEYDANQQAIEETVYLGDLPVVVLKQTVAGTGSSQATTTNVYYVYADHINTPRVITQASDNQMVWRWDNTDPFGLQPPNENPSSLGAFTYNQRFPGQLYDKETNNFYNYHRDYDPSTGRYIESDPIGIRGGQTSTYNYVRGNPVNIVDPNGLRPPTSGEITMLTPIFNDTVDFGKVDIQSGGGFDPRAWGPIATGNAVTLENTIHFPSSGYQSDFSTTDLSNQMWLVHEFGHIYQGQNDPNYSWIKAAAEGLKSDTYKYSLDSNKSFGDYGYEQQAAILADYYRALQQNLPSIDDFKKMLNPKGLGQKDCP
ncbi:RHS repeat-associated core domain-containing protein [Collimonas humicola]|uniref:RHS repeat-associated core domain-containing protein n=1 Tax=Collimonas humicola TaxID=2825886 RepID=UPI001E5D126F|nr:RHS repeat-associated core domain-containing protein [Collimonas humicola]